MSSDPFTRPWQAITDATGHQFNNKFGPSTEAAIPTPQAMASNSRSVAALSIIEKSEIIEQVAHATVTGSVSERGGTTHAEIRSQIERLQKVKAVAIEKEEYERAAEIKKQIQCLNTRVDLRADELKDAILQRSQKSVEDLEAARKELADVKKEKQQAVEAEDFPQARKLKQRQQLKEAEIEEIIEVSEGPEVVYLNILVVDIDREEIKTRVAGQVPNPFGFAILQGVAKEAVGKLVTEDAVAAKMAAKMPEELPGKMAAMGVTATAEAVYQNGSYVVLKVTVLKVNA